MARSARGQPRKSEGGTAAGLGPERVEKSHVDDRDDPGSAVAGGSDLREVFRG